MTPQWTSPLLLLTLIILDVFRPSDELLPLHAAVGLSVLPQHPLISAAMLFINAIIFKMPQMLDLSYWHAVLSLFVLLLSG